MIKAEVIALLSRLIAAVESDTLSQARISLEARRISDYSVGANILFGNDEVIIVDELDDPNDTDDHEEYI